MTIDISNMTDDEFFEAYLTGTESEVVSLMAAITRHENLHRFYSKEFALAALRHAPAIKRLDAQREALRHASAPAIAQRDAPAARPRLRGDAARAAKLQKINAQIVALEERVHQLRMHAAQLKKEN
jgi:hypothetical protein